MSTTKAYLQQRKVMTKRLSPTTRPLLAHKAPLHPGRGVLVLKPKPGEDRGLSTKQLLSIFNLQKEITSRVTE